jgi:hypothetical protein
MFQKSLNMTELEIISNNKNLTETLMKQAENIIVPLPFFIFNEYGMIGGICAAIALLLASHQILMHLYFFNEPKLQLYIVRILLMVPVKSNYYFRYIQFSLGYH